MKKYIYSGATLLVLVLAAYILGWSTLFTVSSIEIKGTQLSVKSLIAPGEKLARVEPRAVIAQYEKIDWVKSVDISRNWFSGKVTISLVERSPIAIYKDRAIDADGVSFALKDLGTGKADNLPHIQAPTVESAVRASMFFITLPIEITQEVRWVKVRSADAYLLEIMKGSRAIEVLWGQDQENVLKAKVYQALLAREENQQIRRIDLTAPHAPIVM